MDARNEDGETPCDLAVKLGMHVSAELLGFMLPCGGVRGKAPVCSDCSSLRPIHKQEGSDTLSGEDLDLFLPTEGLPQWLLDYMKWHGETLASTSDWTRQPLLIHRCIQEDQCGGTADRLKVLPLYLASAARTKRLFFMRWNTPLPLEQFLLPTTAMNWTVPDSLTPFLDTSNTKVEVAVLPSTNLTKSFYGGTIVQSMLKIQKAALDPHHWLVYRTWNFTEIWSFH